MQRSIGQTRLESIAAESPKFTAPLLLIHGLWCSAAVWRKSMGYFAHRGWTCHALNLRGHGAAPTIAIANVCFAEYLADMRSAITACEAAPVLVGHDLGALLALHASQPDVRAIVALAPLVPGAMASGALAGLVGFGTRVAMLRGRALVPPRGARARQFFGAALPGGSMLESSRVIRELARDVPMIPQPTGLPTLVVTADHDPICPVGAVQQLATHMGAELHVVEGTNHALPWEHGWEQRVAEVHRWLIQTLGEPLLAPRDDEDE